MAYHPQIDGEVLAIRKSGELLDIKCLTGPFFDARNPPGPFYTSETLLGMPLLNTTGLIAHIRSGQIPEDDAHCVIDDVKESDVERLLPIMAVKISLPNAKEIMMHLIDPAS